MCHALRVSKQQMADFIQGIPIPKQQPQGDCSNNNNTMKNGNASSASSSSVLAKTKPAKKRQRRTSEQQTQTTTTLLELDAIAASALENTSSNGGAGGGGDVADDLTTQSKILPAGTATCAAASSPSWNGNMTFASSSSSAAAPLVDDTSVVTGANTLHRQDNNNNNINSAVAMFPPPKRQQKPPPQPSLLLLQNNQQQQLQQKRRAQRQQQYQPQNQNQNQPRSTILVPSLPFSPGPVPFNPETARDWIFPLCSTSSSRHATGSTCSGDAVGVGFSKRQYQVDICATAVRHNTLVSLPTGLGKTLIAAVVLYNYHRWFPTGKCIFLATTLPLVQQQVQACFDVMGISVHDTAVLTGKMSPERRADIWKSKSVFFCTPQTVQKDLEAHRLDARQVVCLVLDEAHRATGDYAYCKTVQHLLNIQNGNDTDSTENNQNNDTASAAAAAAPLAKFRLLGLSATPGSTIKAIQAVIDALHINKVEARCDDDADVKQYTHERQYEVIVVPIVSACRDVERMLNDIIGTLLDHLRSRGVFQQHGNATVAQFSVFSSIKNYEQKHGKNADPLGVLPTFYAALKLVGIRSDVHAQGIGVVRSKLLQLKNEPQRGLLKTIVHGPAFQAVWDLVERSTTFSCSSSSSNNPNSGNDGSSNNNKNNKNMSIADKLVNNPKLVKLREILTVHFQQARALGQSSRVIVFAQRRDCIAEIVYILQDLAPMIRSRYFVGQAKGSNDDTTSATTGAATTTEQQQQVKGMRQAEQHEAIRQFRDNVFNVLVCTCEYNLSRFDVSPSHF
jgi:ERCC4-related helicase